MAATETRLYPDPKVKSPYQGRTVPLPTYVCGIVLVPTCVLKVFVYETETTGN